MNQEQSETKGQITIDDVAKLDIRMGKIVEAGRVEGADKLFQFKVDLGEGRLRTILSGIAPHFSSPQALLGALVPVVANLAPRKIRGIESEGMILYAVGDGFLKALSPWNEQKEKGFLEKMFGGDGLEKADIAPGTKVQ